MTPAGRVAARDEHAGPDRHGSSRHDRAADAPSTGDPPGHSSGFNVTVGVDAPGAFLWRWLVVPRDDPAAAMVAAGLLAVGAGSVVAGGEGGAAPVARPAAGRLSGRPIKTVPGENHSLGCTGCGRPAGHLTNKPGYQDM